MSKSNDLIKMQESLQESAQDPTVKEVFKFIEDVKSEMIKIYDKSGSNNARKFKSKKELSDYLDDYPISDFIDSLKKPAKEMAELIMYTP